MSAKKDRKKNKTNKTNKTPETSEKPEKPEANDSGEERSAEAATIGWMLTTLATLVALLCSLGTFLLVRTFENPPPSLELLPGLLLVVASMSGLVSVGLTPLVVRLRKVQPPTAITRGAVVLGAFPIVLMIVLEIIY